MLNISSTKSLAARTLAGSCIAILFFISHAWSQAEVSGNKVLDLYRGALINLAVSYVDSKGERQCETGTGFVISNSGYVITSKHLLLDKYNKAPASTPTIYGSVGKKFSLDPNGFCQVVGSLQSLTIVQTDAIQDVALLKLPAETSYQTVPACRQTQVIPGERLIKLGFPRELPLQPESGEVRALDGPAGMWQVKLSLNEGDSGSPVFNSYGRLIGIVFGDTLKANDIAWIVPIQYFIYMYSTAGVPLIDCSTSSGWLESAQCDYTQRSEAIEATSSDHSRLKESWRDFSWSIQAGGQRVIQSFQWLPKSVNNARGPYINISADRRKLDVQASLSSGPLFDQYRGWINGIIVVNEVSSECLKPEGGK